MTSAQSSAARGLAPGLLGQSSPHPTDFASLLVPPPEGMVLTDEAGLVRYVDPAVSPLLGAGAPSELVGAPLVQALSRSELFDEQGARVSPERLTGIAPRNPAPAPLVVRRLARDGGERWISVTSRSIPDGAGQGGQVLHHVRDVTAHRRAVQGLQLLADTSSLLAASLDYTSTIPRLARRLIPELADGCSVDLLEPDGTLRTVALAFSDSAAEEAAREMRQRYPEPSEDFLRETLASGMPQLQPQVTDELLRLGALSEDHLRLLRALGLRASLAVPLESRGRRLGVLSLGLVRGGRDFDEVVLGLAKKLAGRIALAVDDARLIEDLRRSEERLRLALSAGRAGYFDWDLVTGRAVISPGYEAILGLAPDTFDGTLEGFLSRLHPDDREPTRHAIVSQVESGNALDVITCRVLRPDGAVRWVEAHSQVLRDERGRPLRVIGVAMDITERKAAEESIRRNEERLRLAVTAGRLGTFDWDLTTGTSIISPSFEAMMGFAPGGYDGSVESYMSRVHPDDLEQTARALQENVYGAVGTSVVTHRAMHDDGTVRWVEAHSKYLRDEKGQPLRVIGMAIDITERKAAEAQGQKLAAEQAARATAEAARQRLTAILDSISEPLVALDPEGRIRFANRPAEELVGGALTGQSLREVPPFRDVPELLEGCERALREGAAVEREVMLPDGRWCELRARRYDEGLSVYLHDVTARRREQEVQVRLAAYDALRADVSTMLASRDGLEGVLHRCAASVVRHLGVASARIWLVDARGETLELKASAGPSPHLDDALARVPVGQLQIGRIASERQPHLTHEILQDPTLGGEPWAQQEGIVAFAGLPLTLGDELLGVLAMFSTRKLPSDTLAGLRTVVDAVSYGLGRRRAEQALAERATQLARSNAELEQFAYVASHDLQEPLRVVASFTQLIAQRYRGKLDDKADGYIDFVVDGANRMQRLIQDLLAYSRIASQAKELVPVETGEVVRRVLANLQPAIADCGAELTVDPLPQVEGDDIQLEQLFQNLIGNALKFRAAAPPRIHVSAQREGGDWRFSIRDNGIGIEPRYFQRIFIIFQRLHGKGQYPGTGIGLAICQKIVDRHRGRIWVESTPGQGTTFFFTLPAPADGAAASARST